MTTISPVRPSPIAGMWYEGNPRALSQVVDRYLDQAVIPALPGEVIAVISPHAGHKYSGPVAGYAFATVRSRTFDLVAVLSPMHQPYYDLTFERPLTLHTPRPSETYRWIRN